MPFYTTGGKVSTTTVTGSTFTGLYAPDGSINIVLDDAVNKGAYHPCGALRVSSSNGNSHRDSSGAAHTNRLFGVGR